jgi:LPXTG-motif cell wall-anchored protein
VRGISLGLGIALVGGATLIATVPAQAADSDPVKVYASDIAPNETDATYTQWHQGYASATTPENYSITAEGLKLSGESQIMKGFAESDRPNGTELESAIVDQQVSWTSTPDSDAAFFQLPLFYGDGSSFTTLRPASPVAGDNVADMAQDWVSSKAITAADPENDVAANTPTPLDAIFNALDPSTVQLLGFGVLSQAGETSVVTGVNFNGTSYEFAQEQLAAGTVAISGDAKVGSTLTATVSGWPADATLSYQWFYSGGQFGGEIPGATSSTFTITDEQAALRVGVVVTANQDGYAPSTASTLTDWVVAPQKPAAAAPVANSDGLAAYFASKGVTAQSPSTAGLPTSLDPSKPYTAKVDWAANDSFVDVYVYSTPTFVGTFPVVDGVAQITLSADLLAKLAAGSHTLVVTGQSSGAVQAVSLSVSAVAPVSSLANTGSEATVPALAAALLLLLGAALVVARRRAAARA